ncbi:uncharacterized protein F5891DRAFT_415571 [Suillus fuscotomentosus]|uniref:DUF6697 domain-containing protein n=1 Tax=Suillus fuscotomentosus TaxID=1912939 RepID=A0AAD4HJS3_9AGAM|nr:uncharacterized protein F5891DRAFT_415571 [Suillus fuscotomentosus]KAG1899097.1 hypothetical protein F5891DRAFT_415571 [Suillus fuscotomentosus]
MAHDGKFNKLNEYLVETLGQLLEAKKEATVMRERLTALEADLTERDRLDALKQSENDELRVRSTKLEFEMTQLQNVNAALQLATKDRDALHEQLKVSKMDVTRQQERANTLEQRLQELNNEKTALARELQAAAQIVRVDIGVNTNPLLTPRSTPNGARLPVVLGPSTAGPSRDRNLKEEQDVSMDIFAVHPPSQLPPPRKRAIENAPQLIPDLADGGTVCFTRPFITTHIGGGSQALISNIATPKSLALKFGITSYLCPNLWENPWCPTNPGMAGYMFVGLGEEIHNFVQPEVHELFVGVEKTKYRLMGRYRAHRVEPLTVEEWLTLSEKVRFKYCETTQRKAKDSRSVEGIKAAYERGELRAPCVKLTCLDFKEDLYKKLKARKMGQNNINPSSSQRLIKQELPVTRSSQKRRRIEEIIDVDESSMDSDSDSSEYLG